MARTSPGWPTIWTTRGNGLHQDVEFAPLARADTVDQLSRINRLRVLTLKVHPSAVDLLRQEEPTLYKVFNGSRQIADDDAEYLEINVSVGHRGRGASLGQRLTRLAQRLARRDDLDDIATRFQVTFVDQEDQRFSVNVLDDRLTSTQEIETTAARAGRLAEGSAYSAIRTAYGELRDDLAQAAALERIDD